MVVLNIIRSYWSLINSNLSELKQWWLSTWNKRVSNSLERFEERLCYVTDQSVNKDVVSCFCDPQLELSWRCWTHSAGISSPQHWIYPSEMNTKLLHRRVSTPSPMVDNFLDKPTKLCRRNTVPSRLELIPESIQQQEFVRCKNKKNLRPNTASPNETIKLPWIDMNREEIKSYHLGSNKLDALCTAKGTVERLQRLSHRDDFSSRITPCVTSQRHCNMVSKDTSLPRQFLCGSDHQGHSKALRHFIKNAEETFDSSKEKTMILYNWMSSQTLLSRSWENIFSDFLYNNFILLAHKNVGYCEIEARILEPVKAQLSVDNEDNSIPEGLVVKLTLKANVLLRNFRNKKR